MGLIDIDAFLKDLEYEGADVCEVYDGGYCAIHGYSFDLIKEIINNQSIIEAEPVRHGRWELHGNDDDCGCSYFCSECHKSYDEDWFYTHGEYTPFKCCPNCTAKMDGNQ